MCPASTSMTVPGDCASTTSPVSIAARYSSPVPTIGAWVIISGTACLCMFAPISARFASLCSRNGISAVPTETICAGAQRREAAPVRQPGQRVRLVHELRQLRRAEELLQRSHDRTDVDDRLRRNRVDVLRRHPLPDDALHAIEADPERLLDQLPDRAQTAVAEVLVLIELTADRIAREHDRVGREVLRLEIDAETVGHLDQPLDEREDDLGRQDAHVVRHLHLEPLIQLVAADLRQVVALRIEEQRLQQVARVVERRRLAGALLLEHLDQGLLLARRGVLLERVDDEDRVVEELEDGLVRRGVELEARGRVLLRESPKQRRDRQLALPVDAGVDDALLVDLELEPRAAGWHQVRREDLLRGVLGLHQVGARAANELRHDHALGAVDDEGAPLGHHREVPHEDRLLSDLARLLVDEADGHRERCLVRQILLATLLDRELRLPELVGAELDGQGAGVVLDRRDVVDRLAKTLVQEPLERGLLDVDQIGKVEDVLETRETGARARRSDLGGQEMKPPLEIRCENWNGGQTGVDRRNSGATRQGTREPRICARVALRNPPITGRQCSEPCLGMPGGAPGAPLLVKVLTGWSWSSSRLRTRRDSPGVRRPASPTWAARPGCLQAAETSSASCRREPARSAGRRPRSPRARHGRGGRTSSCRRP